MMEAKILLVDDDPHILEVLRFALEAEGFTTQSVENGVDALTAFAKEAPDLLVLDIMMPEMDGTEVCRRIRQTSRVPILFLSSRDDELDRILGLELGGDDYVAKPFSPRELVARVKAVLRRAAPIEPETGDAPLRHGPLTLDPKTYTAWWHETEVPLTLTEYGILRTLFSPPGKVFRREDLMAQAYELARIVSDRTIDSHVRRVRSKFAALGAHPIDTVHGIGYKLAAV